jgi:hypothetical protein
VISTLNVISPLNPFAACGYLLSGLQQNLAESYNPFLLLNFTMGKKFRPTWTACPIHHP